MGPRAGSPAAETRREDSNLEEAAFLVVLANAAWCAFIVFFLAIATPALAETAQAHQTLTIIIGPPGISISEKKESTETTGLSYKTHYLIHNSRSSSSAVDGALTAQVEETSRGIVVWANVGNFRSDIQEESLALYQHASGYQIVGPSATALADSTETSDGRTHILSGSLPVTWKAIPTRGIPSSNHPILLTVTLKDN